MAKPKKSKTAKEAGRRIAQSTKAKQRQQANRIKNYPDIGRPPEDAGTGVAPPPPSPGPGPGEGGPPPDEPPDDLGIPGLPPDVAAKIHQYAISGRDDWQQQAIHYLMGTSWFKQEYAGYDAGFANGLFGDPLSGGLAQYRSWKSDVQGYYQQFYGRLANVQELQSFATNHWDAAHVGAVGQGYANVQANQGDWNYLTGAFGGGQLTEDEKRAYGEELAGIDTSLGQKIKARVDAALQRYQGAFQGQLGGSALGDQQLGARLQKKPDIAA